VIPSLVRVSAAFAGAPNPAGEERARLEAALERATSALPAGRRRLLALGLGVLDALARVRRLRRFERLDDPDARALLDAVGASPLRPLRRLHASLRMMTQLAWYADPGHWAECGYDGPWLGRVDVERGPPPEIGAPA
jgi:hypothetical protein